MILLKYQNKFFYNNIFLVFGPCRDVLNYQELSQVFVLFSLLLLQNFDNFLAFFFFLAFFQTALASSLFYCVEVLGDAFVFFFSNIKIYLCT